MRILGAPPLYSLATLLGEAGSRCTTRKCGAASRHGQQHGIFLGSIRPINAQPQKMAGRKIWRAQKGVAKWREANAAILFHVADSPAISSSTWQFLPPFFHCHLTIDPTSSYHTSNIDHRHHGGRRPPLRMTMNIPSS